MKATIALVAVAVAAGLVIASCDSEVTCGPGTMLVNGACVSNDAGVGGAQCGMNTSLDNGNCELVSSACGPGTVLDAVTHSCQIPTNHGTMIWQSTMTNSWFSVAVAQDMADAGVQYNPPGVASLPAGTDLSQKLFMFDGSPMGQLTNIPVTWFAGNVSYTWTAIDHQITVGEWNQCHASYEVYKDPPSGKKTYNIVVRLQGCPKDIQFSVWEFLSTDGTLDNRKLAVPLGGLPNAFNVSSDGTALFEREIDPNVYTKVGNNIVGACHSPGNGNTCSAVGGSDFFYVDLAYHNGGQSNGNWGNGGFCVADNMGKCLTPPAPNLYLPGALGIDWGGIMTGGTFDPVAEDPNAPTTTKPIPVSMLQPY